ncbi:MAG: 50S ribosomal protein L34e [Nitrosarchaeum sp.]|nr:50S ribosomal protein L34e [Nitrosarchaeum sp.]
MPQGMHKSRTFKRKQVPVPGGQLAKHFVKPNPKQASCAACGRALHGIPRKSPTQMHNLPKTMKRPERPYGGVLCSSCMRHEMVQKARAESQE